MKRLGVMSIAALAIGGAANAGSYTAPVIEAPVIAPAAPALSHSNTWTGFYAGMQMSYSDFSVNRDGVDDATGGVYGIHAGYNHQLHNNMVIGGEITFDHSSADNDVWQVERLMTVRARWGMPIIIGWSMAWQAMRMSGPRARPCPWKKRRCSFRHRRRLCRIRQVAGRRVLGRLSFQ